MELYSLLYYITGGVEGPFSAFGLESENTFTYFVHNFQ